jgi:hypothetical protein
MQPCAAWVPESSAREWPRKQRAISRSCGAQHNYSDRRVCAIASLRSRIPKSLFTELRESGYPGGMAHGCELETSDLLYLRPDLVQFEKAEREIKLPERVLLLGPASSVAQLLPVVVQPLLPNR